MREIDVRHLSCPGPVLELRKLLEAGEPSVRLHVADEMARTNVTRFAASRGAESSAEPAAAGGFLVTVHAGVFAPLEGSAGDLPVMCDPVHAAEGPLNAQGPLVIQVGSEVMGTGEDELGALLLRSFFKSLSGLPRHPDTVIFYNRGVFLCCMGSPLLEELARLEAQGVEVIACGTCVNYFELKDRLAVGRVTDMLEIATRLSQAGSVIRP